MGAHEVDCMQPEDSHELRTVIVRRAIERWLSTGAEADAESMSRVLPWSSLVFSRLL